jgi:hypothetical protein
MMKQYIKDTPDRVQSPTEIKPKGQHRPGSRKGQAHKLFDELGPDAARPKILALGIKRATITSWFKEFRKIKANMEVGHVAP